MAEERLALSELLEKAGDGDFLRTAAEAVLQLLMEADVDGLIGAGRYERSGERTTWRNGFRDRALDTRQFFAFLQSAGRFDHVFPSRPPIRRAAFHRAISGRWLPCEHHLFALALE